MLPLLILLLLGSPVAAVNVKQCDSSLIEGGSTKEISIDFVHEIDKSDAIKGHLVVKCIGKSSLKAIKLNSGREDIRSNLYASLTCDAVKGWTAYTHSSPDGHYYKVAEASEPLNISCHEYCAVEPKDDTKIILSSLDDVSSISVECPGAKFGELFFNFKHVEGDKLTCSLGGGWTQTNSVVLSNDTSTPLKVECKDLSHCDPSLITAVRPNEIEVFKNKDGGWQLSCAYDNSSVKFVKVDGYPYENLWCNEEGWGRAELFAKHSALLKFTCYDHCKVAPGLISTTTKYNEDWSKSHTLTMKCPNEYETLYNNGVPVPTNQVHCNYELKSFFLTEEGTGGLPYLTNPPNFNENLECRRGYGKRSSRTMRTAEEKEETRESERLALP